MCNLGLLRSAQNREFGEDSAQSWWTQAAEVGHADSVHNLAQLRAGQDRTIN
jgi:TPR repeat protein